MTSIVIMLYQLVLRLAYQVMLTTRQNRVRFPLLQTKSPCLHNTPLKTPRTLRPLCLLGKNSIWIWLFPSAGQCAQEEGDCARLYLIWTQRVPSPKVGRTSWVLPPTPGVQCQQALDLFVAADEQAVLLTDVTLIYLHCFCRDNMATAFPSCIQEGLRHHT